MKKQRFLQIIFIILTMFILSGCGVKKLSGTYVSEQNSDEYLKFSGESKVSLYSENEKIDGSYRIEDGLVLAYFDSEDASLLLEIKDKKTLYYGMNAYVKVGFWKKHWKKIVIVIVVFGIISAVYKKITGRELEDDIENFFN